VCRTLREKACGKPSGKGVSESEEEEGKRGEAIGRITQLNARASVFGRTLPEK